MLPGSRNAALLWAKAGPDSSAPASAPAPSSRANRESVVGFVIMENLLAIDLGPDDFWGLVSRPAVIAPTVLQERDPHSPRAGPDTNDSACRDGGPKGFVFWR